MKTLFKKANSYNIDFSEINAKETALDVSKRLCEEYPNIPIDIMRYFFVRHSNQADEILESIQPLNAKDIHVSKISLSNEEILDENIIHNASFTRYSEPIRNNEFRDVSLDWYKNTYFKNGTWDYPIITVRENNQYIVIDGTNRFRHLIQCLLYKYDFIKDKHEIYVLN